MKTTVSRALTRRRQAAYYLMLALGAVAAVSLFFSGAVSAQETFDHFSTGFILDGAHVNVTCDGCHVGATFAPTASNCSSCHAQGSIVQSSSKPPDHVLTTGECSDCHITASWTVISFVDHSSLTGSCVSCHNGTQATGKDTDTHFLDRSVRGLPHHRWLAAGHLRARQHLRQLRQLS